MVLALGSWHTPVAERPWAAPWPVRGRHWCTELWGRSRVGPSPLFSFSPVPTVVGFSQGSRAPDTVFLSPLMGGASGSPWGARRARPGREVSAEGLPRAPPAVPSPLPPEDRGLGDVFITSASSSRRTTAPSCPTRGRKTSTRTASGMPATTMTTTTASRTRRWAAPVPRAFPRIPERLGPFPSLERPGPSSHRERPGRGAALRSARACSHPLPPLHRPEGPRPSLHSAHGGGRSAPLGKVTVHRRDFSPQRG